ncbi:hypothetical protein U1Q18_040965 [Sarracenia purpurea var. burkii]
MEQEVVVPPPPPPVISPIAKPEKLDLPMRSIINRHGYGSAGRPISLLTNHFKVSVKYPDEIFYQYSVAISSEDKRVVESKGVGRKAIAKLFQTYSSELAGKRFAYDGEKTLYTVGSLPQNKLEFTVLLEESFVKQCSCNLTARLICQAVTNYRYEDDPFLAACGISIEKQLTPVDGRVLEAPKVNLT